MESEMIDSEPAVDSESAGLEFTEDELIELALSGDVEAPIADDAIPLSVYLGQIPGLLPSWYMPSPMARSGKRWRTPVVLAIVGAFLIIEAFGLCSTFGQLVPA
jgi:hypothetical protein